MTFVLQNTEQNGTFLPTVQIYFSHHLISSYNDVEQECWSSMVRGARELCCGAVDISNIMWNLSTLASSCEVHRRPWSPMVLLSAVPSIVTHRVKSIDGRALRTLQGMPMLK
jgi:hypothetical protein